ncbi:rab geranylgeranyl transferase escort protein-like protein [Lophiotrema nucula]|uniref:Rab proteins geranylgeranyltransferase n=1 Tax=Lophiotrema nucula TaxID=690887 RepID=A0A6A5ZAZ0_9PLEO|nr:rab geranylgeranyl transferase escort protein-like protein [Lophiotrema nucula]
MDTLDNSEWDVVIVGTGLRQSLLALALSRSDKKILHIDENDYYGGAEAAFSLQEAEEWAKSVDESSTAAAFFNTSVTKPDLSPDSSTPQLSPSRKYSLALSPQLVYARSALIQSLISSKVYRQLEFLAVGSWWVYTTSSGNQALREPISIHQTDSIRGSLLKVPSGREDVFQDQVLDFKSKRALMKFLRFISDYEEQPQEWKKYEYEPFTTFLIERFKVPEVLHAPLLALTLTSASSDQVSTMTALPRIARHLRSIGVFGSGFGSVIPRWGGMAEIAQVGCRACAVGGGVYVLGKGIAGEGKYSEFDGKLRLKDGENITTKWCVRDHAPSGIPAASDNRSVTIVSSDLAPLFPSLGEEAPIPACAIINFPSGSIPVEGWDQERAVPSVQIAIHSSDTGECPPGQSILYGYVALSGAQGSQLLKKAVESLLASVDITPAPTILWSLQYEQRCIPVNGSGSLHMTWGEGMLTFKQSQFDLAFDDRILDEVKEIWQKIMGEDAGDFLVFEDREPDIDDDD